MEELASRPDWPRAIPRCPLRPASQLDLGQGLCRARGLPQAPQANTCPLEPLGRRLSGAHASCLGHRAQMLKVLGVFGAPAGTRPASRAGPGASDQAGEGAQSRHDLKQLGSGSSSKSGEGRTLTARTPRFYRRPCLFSPHLSGRGRLAGSAPGVRTFRTFARAKGYSESLRGLAGGVTGVPTSCPEMDQHQPSSVGPMGAAAALGGGLQSPERESGLSQQCQSRTGLRGWFGKN